MTSSVRTYGFGSVERLAEALRPWQGGQAQVLGYTSTPGKLDVWLTKAEAADSLEPALEGGLLLQCLRCSAVYFVPSWAPTSFELAGVSRGPNEWSLEIRDAESFSVQCWDAQVTGVFESVESVTAWRSGKRTSVGPLVD